MIIPFKKYHGTGNDFIVIDDRNEIFDVNDSILINQMCSRRFGIGADGLILLRQINDFDFRMVYFNSDGNQGTMCGNGGRCIVHFAHSLGLFKEKCSFFAADGPHTATMLNEDNVRLKMGDVAEITLDGNALVLDTGSPHYVIHVKNLDSINVKEEGASIRYSEKYRKNGVNVNFLEYQENQIHVATYERGVEDETYSCGTGVTASALGAHFLNPLSIESPATVKTKGGDLKVFFTKASRGYTDIWLEGPAIVTFEGHWLRKG